MGHSASVIRSDVMEELGSYGRTAPLALWVVQELDGQFATLGVYARIASAAAHENPDTLCVTASREWADLLFHGELRDAMDRLLEIGAITKVAAYRSGKVRLRVEPYPPDVREELESYRRPDGRLVVAFA